MDERLLELYNLELRHLRETAAEFGRDFPKIAGRLSLDLDAKEVCPILTSSGCWKVLLSWRRGYT